MAECQAEVVLIAARGTNSMKLSFTEKKRMGIPSSLKANPKPWGNAVKPGSSIHQRWIETDDRWASKQVTTQEKPASNLYQELLY